MTDQTLPAPLKSSPLVSDWIRFRGEGTVLVLSGRVELGQGNMTAILQIAADELDLPADKLRISGADTRSTPNEGFTSGSLSIAQGGMSVRWAASAARTLILAEARRLTQGAAEDLTIEDGRILRGGADTGLDLFDIAAKLDFDVPVAEHAAPKPPGARRLAGRTLARWDLAERVTGSPFVHDLVFDEMVHGRPLHPPAIGAELTDLDIEGLKARPGVISVVRDGSFVGIIAETEPQAIAAQNWAKARATWSAPPAGPGDPLAYMAAEAGEEIEVHNTGDVTGAEGEVIETMITKPYLCHASIGPSAAVALWDGERMTVWCHAQGVYPLREAIADVLGLPADRIDAIHRPGAGCYGHNGADDVSLDAALMARALQGRPVRVQWGRAEELCYAPLGPGMAVRARAVLGRDGQIAAMEVIASSAPHGNRPGRAGAPNLRASHYLEKPFPVKKSGDVPPANGGGADRNAVPYYAIPSVRSVKRLIHDLPYRTSSMRALGAFGNVYAIETLMDEVAAAAGQNPVAFRLAHLDDPRARAVVEAAAGAGRGLMTGEAGSGEGWGIAFARYKNTAGYAAVIARVKVEDEVRVTRVVSAVDTGEIINPDGVKAQIEGGIIQSISWVLKEAAPVTQGRVEAESWLDYPILRFSEVPEVEVHLLDRPDEPPLGCAEAAQGPTGAAVGNAVRMALGAGVRNLPISREAVIAAISGA